MTAPYLFGDIITTDMKEVNVELPHAKQRGYKIYVDAGAIGRIGRLFDLGAYSKIVVVTDDTAGTPLLQKLLGALPDGASSVTIPTGERSKTVESVQEIWKALHDAGCDRRSLVINLGGGVVGDVGGFAAATYMRGIGFINVPTSLLAQADASVGGKTGFNFDGIKNLVGTFSQPAGVVIDPQALATLPDREFISGFGEIIKHGIIKDEKHFEAVTAKPPLEFSEDELTDIIAASCRIKAGLVQDDEAESGARKLLNFGHTVGHAVEALSLETDKPLLHGEAVSIGMAAEAAISVKSGLLQAADLKKLTRALAAAGLPVTIGSMHPDAIQGKMQSDKKNAGGKLNFTLIDRIGHAVYDQQVPSSVVTEAIQAILD